MLRDVVENDDDIVAGPFGSNLKVSDYRENGIPIIRLQNIERNEFIHKDIKYVSNKKADELKYHSFRAGDIVLAKLGDPIGKACMVPPSLEKGIVVADAVRIRISPRKASACFVEYILNSPVCTLQLKKETIGTTRPRVNIIQIRNLKIPLPPLPEQKKIAEILSTVDQAIEKVDEAIEKTQKLKKALMQELLTKGIGHKEFKDTEIGKIPKEWKVYRLGEIGKLERGKFAFRPRNDPRFYGGKYPFIQTGDIGEANGIIQKYSQTLNEEGFKISKSFNRGTIVISIAGNIGDVGILDFDSCFPDSVVGIAPLEESVKPHFLMYLLWKFRSELNSIAPRSTQKNINLGILESFKLPIPPVSEQQKIAEILGSVDKRLELLKNRRERLERVKKGLMEDLLTGKKRVKLES
jgi:type I restriction enzyme S subunit